MALVASTVQQSLAVGGEEGSVLSKPLEANRRSKLQGTDAVESEETSVFSSYDAPHGSRS